MPMWCLRQLQEGLLPRSRPRPAVGKSGRHISVEPATTGGMLALLAVALHTLLLHMRSTTGLSRCPNLMSSPTDHVRPACFRNQRSAGRALDGADVPLWHKLQPGLLKSYYDRLHPDTPSTSERTRSTPPYHNLGNGVQRASTSAAMCRQELMTRLNGAEPGPQGPTCKALVAR